MKSRTRTVGSFYLALITLSAFTLQGCTPKKRQPEFVQGQGADLVLISDLNGKEFPLSTGGYIAAGSQTGQAAAASSYTQAAKPNIDKDSGLRLFEPVTYETGADLLGKSVPLRARPETKDVYKIKYQVSANYLKIYNVASEGDIHMHDIPFAEPMADGKLGVPLVGYKVALFRVERVKAGNDEDTHKLTQIPESDPAKATHIVVDRSSREEFDAITKMDIFTRSLLEGEWYYSATIIDSNEDNRDAIGMYLNRDYSFSSATRLKMVSTQNVIRGYNVNVDERTKSSDEINLTPVFELPVEWKEYRAVKVGKENGLKEEEVTENPWQKRPYVKFDLSKASIVSLETSNMQVTEKRVVDISLGKNYIGFTHFLPNAGVRIRYSFLRTDGRNYQGRRYHLADLSKFGFFYDQAPVIKNYEIRTIEDLEKNLKINRFDPEKGEIVFHFSNQSTKDPLIRETGRKAVDSWNEAFKKAGTKLTIRLDESFDADLGDLRYNTINLIESVGDRGGLFGFGPSITDPKTGEIISASANVHISNVRAQVIEYIRRFILGEIGLLKGSEVDALGGGAMDVAQFEQKSHSSGALNDTSVSPRNLTELSMDELTHWINGISDGTSKLKIQDGKLLAEVSTHKDESKTGSISKLRAAALLSGSATGSVEEMKELLNSIRQANSGKCDGGVSSKYIPSVIREKCPAVMSLIKKINSDPAMKQGIIDSDFKSIGQEEVQASRACSDFITPDKVLATLVHEMGHNFGLFHNFKGSVDKANWLSKEETGTKEQVQSSSTMEYTAFDQTRLLQPAKYDIAAIRYGYGNQVESDDGQMVAITGDKPIKEVFESLGKSPKPYMFCSNFEEFIGNDPMCLQWDAGVTPEESIAHQIDEFQSDFKYMFFRYGRAWSPSITGELLTGYFASKIARMKRFYDEFRFQLKDTVPGYRSDDYLTGVSPEDWNETLKKIDEAYAKDPTYVLGQYKKSGDMVYNFLMKLATMPDQYCLFFDAKGTYLTAQEFLPLMNTLYSRTRHVARSCEDSELLKYMGATSSSSKGMQLYDVQHDLNLEYSSLLKPNDVLGAVGNRIMATLFLNVRVPLKLSYKLPGRFSPNFMDEPTRRFNFINWLLNRSLEGLDPAEIGLTEAQVKNRLVRFTSEDILLNVQTQFSIAGLTIPGQMDLTLQRIAPLAVLNTREPSLDPSVSDTLRKAGYTTFTKLGRDIFASKANAQEGGMSAAYIDKLELIRFMPTPPEAVHEALSNQFTPIFTSAMAPRARSGEMAVGAAIQVYNNLMQMISPIPGLLDEFSLGCQGKPSKIEKQEAMCNLFRFGGMINKKLASFGRQGDPTADAARKEFLAKKFSEASQEIGVEENPIHREALGDFVSWADGYVELIHGDYVQNKQDYDNQMELIINMLKVFSQLR